MEHDQNPLPLGDAPVAHEAPADIQARIDFAHSVVQRHQTSRRQRLVTILLSVVLLVIVGAFAYWLFTGKKSPTHAGKAASTQQAVRSATSSNEAAPSVATKSYTSSDFNLSLNYPDTWNLVDNGNGPMTITSPAVQLTSAAGRPVTGEITMTIQQQGQLPASFSAGTALAVLNSQMITYKQPTASQTSQAYLSFVQYSSTTTKGGLDGIYLTGNDGYQKDQVIPASDVAGVNPLVTVTFTACGNATCTANLNPLTIASTSWSKSAFETPIMAMLSSLSFQ
jgi:cytoskeletal protein RodZ